ncbi:hypothetical protein B0I08_108104 [Glaciihabitans tibetensis]|uniref:Uncharacterized protein n=2 Tax=Glaciihabitans tibetensis TaxID=1266600 RepID=A0A2T0VA10_9MICO|nr:hypothetical protein B0I08_108104 [Glaciihabitans tibetensis]
MSDPTLLPVARPRSYRIIIPPTWVMIPVGDGTDKAIDTLLEERFAGLPMDSYGPRKTRVAESLRKGIASARKAHAVDVIFPVETPWEVPLSAGIVMSQVPTNAPSEVAAKALIKHMHAARPGSTIVATRAGDALREVVDHPDQVADHPDQVAGAGEPAPVSGDAPISAVRTLYYSWAVPERNSGTLVAVCSISGGHNAEYAPIVEAFTELFDIMMETLAWSRVSEDAR